MTTAEIIMSIIGIVTLIGGFIKAIHSIEDNQADRKAFEKKTLAILENINEQYKELQKQIEASREDRRALDRRISIVEESTKLSHTRIDNLSDKLEALRDKIK
nr:MAG TPA: SECRETED 45 KDA PROTEIN CYCLE, PEPTIDOGLYCAN, CHAP, CELL [Caudoviricetes sp.]